MTESLNWNIGDFVGFMVQRSLQPQEASMELSENAQWHCVIVKPSTHRRVELDLARLGFRSFYPKVRRWRSHARTKTAVERPILNRYMFVEIDHPRQSYATVTNIFDVECLVSNLGRPIPFPAHWVESALRRYLSGEFDEVANGPLPVGARIKIMEGEFEDQLATIVSAKGHRVDFKIHGDSVVRRMNDCSVRPA